MTGYSEDDIDKMTRTIIMEARGETWEGKVAVGWTIRNRHESPVKWWQREDDTVPDDTIAAVCVDAWQFSGWNTGDPNLRFAAIIPRNHPVYMQAQRATLTVLLAMEPDRTKGATHYYAKSMPTPPKWSRGKAPSHETGGHLFFNNIE